MADERHRAVLLDTHVLIWALREKGRLNARARSLLQDDANAIAFSAASIWEIAIKTALGRPGFRIDARLIIEEAFETGFIEWPIRADVAAQVATLPHHHSDPFDRLLIAQAMTADAHLLTADRVLLQYTDLAILVTA